MTDAVVLYVEDAAANAKLMERILERRPGVRLVVATTGAAATELARRHRPGLVLLDLHLPDVPGDEVLRRLRADPLTAAVPVVVVSGDTTPDRAQQLRDLGATGFLAKPFDVPQLLALVEELEQPVD